PSARNWPRPERTHGPGRPGLTPVISPSELESLNEQFKALPTVDVLGWAWDRFGARASIGTAFQGAGLVMMHLAREKGYRFPVFTLDTGLLFPETLELKT